MPANKVRDTVTCHQCGKTIVKPRNSCTTGYGIDQQGNKVCFACCAVNDKAALLRDGHSKSLPLYLSKGEKGWTVGNWPGSLSFKPFRSSTGNHNIAGKRHDVWFTVPGDSKRIWHGVQYGQWTQICHCRRTSRTLTGTEL